MFRTLFLFLFLSCAAVYAELSLSYQNDFQATEVGKLPEGFQVIAGNFKVQEKEGHRFLELPGAPLDSFSVLFGTAQAEGVVVSAKCFGTKTGRKFPTFALGLNGGGGFRLQMSPAKTTLEIIRGDLSRASVPFEWKSGEWVMLKLQIRKVADKWWVEGKAWLAADKEPAGWNVTYEETVTPPSGRASLWGSPFSGTPIRFDDVVICNTNS